ncbi:MAG: helix-turn-helix domain-containing protein [Planctomycetota bacterium]|nr:helix-turn-helix domain-containing protein [Planctomycetota bacterium]
MSKFGQELVDGLREFSQALRDIKSGKKLEKLDGNLHDMAIKTRNYDPKLVKNTRDMLGVSQSLFAKFLGVSTSTVAAWEQGSNAPSDMACRFMDEIREEPAYWIARIQRTITAKKKKETA